MGDIFPKFKAAAVQAASVYLDREKSLEKTVALIEEAASQGATLIVLPESFIPGYPPGSFGWGLRSPGLSSTKGCSGNGS